MTRYARAVDVGFVDDGIRVFAAVLPDGPLLVLSNESALVWRAAAPGVDAAELALHVRDAGSANPLADAVAFAGALVDAGLLTVDEEN